MTSIVRAATWICILCVSAAGCGTPTDVKTEQTDSDKSSEIAAMPDETSMQKWAKSCALCHVDGVGGAPRTGVADDWTPRLAQGKQLLMEHTIEGFNNMPPLGYCMSCETDDFSTMIDFMTNTTGESL
ncbi:MAG: c-type cytochrome [bacterium]